MTPQPPCALRVTHGTGPSAALELLAVAQAMPSESRLAPGPVARVTRLAPLVQRLPRGPQPIWASRKTSSTNSSPGWFPKGKGRYR
jgi:hypothetical protein